jgi:hypothetical protein
MKLFETKGTERFPFDPYQHDLSKGFPDKYYQEGFAFYVYTLGYVENANCSVYINIGGVFGIDLAISGLGMSEL